MLNGNNVGNSDSVYASNSLANGDSIFCIVSTNSSCILHGPDSSNIAVMQINSVNSSVTIASSANKICMGDTVLFRAMPVNGGTSPDYEWQVNGMNVGKNSDTLLTSSLMNGDVVSCILRSSLLCAMPVPSAESISMVVNPSPVLSFSPDTVIIKPSESKVLDPKVSGSIASYQWTPANGLDNPFVANPAANPESTTIYHLTVVSDNGCSASGKITLVVYYPLKVPNAFTPNGDGKNDVFRIPPSTRQKIKSFSVFNRWGELLFSTTNSSSGWDGTFKHQPQPAGTYVWQIEYEDLLTRRFEVAKGTLILIR